MKETAIVIDDDDLVNESLTNLLEFMGIKVIGRGYDGKEAADLFSKHNPNYSLIDLTMPNYDGFFAIKNIQKINKNAKIFAITGDTTQKTKEKLEDLDISGIIYKPYDLNALMEKLKLSKTGN